MRTFLLPLMASLVLGLSACTSTAPRARINYVPPSTVPIKQSVVKAQTHAETTHVKITDAQIKALAAKENIVKLEGVLADQPVVVALAQAVHKELDELTLLLMGANYSNEQLKLELGQTTLKIDSLQLQVNTQTTQLNERGEQLNKALAQGEIDRANAHKFKAILVFLGTLAVLAVIFGLFGMRMFVPPILWLTIGAPAATAAFLFFYLG